jgi:hypothetical protein
MPDLPTDEQRRATSRRYQGQRTPVAPEVVEEVLGQPPKPPIVDEPGRGCRKAFWHWARWLTFWTVIGLIVEAIGAHQVDGPNVNASYTTVPAYPVIYPFAHRATVVLAITLGVVGAFWFLVGMGAYFRLVRQTTRKAMEPAPTLAEIDQQLRAEGHDPSIADVAAMHQYLTSQRNEAALLAGALVIGPQLLVRQTQGKPLI